MPTIVDTIDGSRLQAKPVVKWPGGKRRLVNQILEQFPEPPIHNYWEPFAGGAAIFLAVANDVSASSIISDTNSRLIQTYVALSINVERVVQRLADLARQHSEEFYYQVRKEYNNGLDEIGQAAAFIYMNRVGFNGLYRENRKGEFNVPYGHRPFSFDPDNFRVAAALFAQADLRVGDFSQVTPTGNDVVYCDPPYHRTFTSYTGTGFTDVDQVRLRDACLTWRDAGATVIVSNSLTEFTIELYRDFEVKYLQANRLISRNGDERQSVVEMLAILRP